MEIDTVAQKLDFRNTFCQILVMAIGQILRIIFCYFYFSQCFVKLHKICFGKFEIRS